jgi:hypothetical protein
MDVHQHHFLYVPVRHTAGGMDTLTIAHTPEGERAGIAFSSAGALAAACRPSQSFTEMAEDALREMLAPLGITRIQLDPAAVGTGHAERAERAGRAARAARAA